MTRAFLPEVSAKIRRSGRHERNRSAVSSAPVRITASTGRWVTRCRPTSLSWVRTNRTTSAARRRPSTCATISAQRGVSGAGLNITVLPAASAEMTPPAGWRPGSSRAGTTRIEPRGEKVAPRIVVELETRTVRSSGRSRSPRRPRRRPRRPSSSASWTMADRSRPRRRFSSSATWRRIRRRSACRSRRPRRWGLARSSRDRVDVRNDGHERRRGERDSAGTVAKPNPGWRARPGRVSASLTKCVGRTAAGDAVRPPDRGVVAGRRRPRRRCESGGAELARPRPRTAAVPAWSVEQGRRKLPVDAVLLEPPEQVADRHVEVVRPDDRRVEEQRRRASA